jgi:hypothetical protein
MHCRRAVSCLLQPRLRGGRSGLTQHFHPDFGYFYPVPRFRRDVRVASVAAACGAALGAIAVVAVSVSYPEVHTASSADVQSSVGVGPQTTSVGRQDHRKIETSHLKPAVTGLSNNGAHTTGINGTAVSARPSSPPAQTNAQVCGESGSTGSCISEKLRQATSSLGDNGSVIGGVPLGRHEGAEATSSVGARGEALDSSELTEASRAVPTPLDTSAALKADNAARNRPGLTGEPEQKSPRKITGRHLLRNQGPERAAVARRDDRGPARSELGAYARNSVQRSTTVFWEWSR